MCGMGEGAVDELLDVRLLLGSEQLERIDLVLEAAAAHGVPRVREAAGRAASSPRPLLQAAGVLALGALGIDDAASRDLLATAAVTLVGSKDDSVREAVADAAGLCSTDGRMTLPLLVLADDASTAVRLAAVRGLAVSADDEPDDGGDVATLLLRRFDDPDATVRDFAVPALGVNRDVDSPAIRDALVRRLVDEEADAAGEAAVALAMRADRRVLPLLLEHLGRPDVGNLWVEAAAELADPVTLPALLALRDAGWAEHDDRPQILAAAIQACSGAAT
jgi:hypothetical protein